MSEARYQVYLAGELFSYKALAGNQLLGKAIEDVSQGRFQVLLPQDIEMPSDRAKDIRNADYAAVINSDLIIAQFDGSELDSGTVAEFMLAKQLDIPAVLFRSDFRKAGDQESGGDAWNLMVSHFPRTESLAVNAMALYHQADGLTQYIEHLAHLLVEKLDVAVASAPLVAMTEDQAILYYRQTLIRLGMVSYLSENDVSRIVQAKLSKKLL
ncbi:nucleoside 2-deoxyribosyltransferase [Litoribrevibacter albus]|uniref:Nucleoside 2-deoxyribosyltransferase n=1 Tax=Litoribrevibacter albus TaxID=1473156 RepID=A0AA37SAL7_9GAMM|nr:nucleoside 2-deoxyribosyltransferase [Litoribrevibacter albus]GLQ31217.1 hypothetical protein GCM10007876_16960 [Litoribrevibacter albus]